MKYYNYYKYGKNNSFSFERRLRSSNYSWENQHRHEILSHRAGTDPARVPAYCKCKTPFSHGI